jgi:hypothetical protein
VRPENVRLGIGGVACPAARSVVKAAGRSKLRKYGGEEAGITGGNTG